MGAIYDLYASGGSALGIEPDGPIFGKLTITDEVDKLPLRPLRKCIVEVYDEEAKRRGSTREFWMHTDGDALVHALAHLNGEG